MSFSTINGLFTVNFDALGTVTIALIMLLIGTMIKKQVRFMRTYCIPAPVIGGTLFALIKLAFYQSNFLSIKLASTYQTDMQNIFFTIVGFGISLSLLKKGGARLIKYFILTAVLIILQGVVGVAVAKHVGLHSVFAIVCGPASLAGGHGNVAAYGKLLEDMGHTGTLVAGIAAACFGLITGSFFGGPLARNLIRKYRLSNSVPNAAPELNVSEDTSDCNYTLHDIFIHVAIIGTFMTAGSYIGKMIGNALSISIPSFTGAMLLAFIVRNLNEKFKFLHFSDVLFSKIQNFSLGIFLSMAMISLNLWQLYDLALPMMAILLTELLMTLAFIRYIVFPFLGKDFDAAIMCAGLCGHGLGATPNGLANMDSVTEEYGYSPISYLVVSITGGILASWTLIIVNTFMVNLLA